MLQRTFMRLRYNYIFFFLISLSLFGFGNDLLTSKINVRYLKETEWISKPATKSKIIKCIHFHVIDFVASTNPSVHLSEKQYCNTYNQKIIVHFLNQTRLFRNIKTIINLISQRRYIPRLFTDGHKGHGAR